MDCIQQKQLDLPKKLDKPWFREAYSAALRFHEKDKVLDSKDRLDLFNAYKSMAKSQVAAGWAGFLGVFATPFAYKYYLTKSIKGVKVPRNFFISMIGMLVSTHFASNIAYKRQLKKLDPEGELSRKIEYSHDELLEDNPNTIKPRNQRQFEMLSLLKNGGSPRWAAYFYMTYLHPDRTFPDPELKLKEFQKEKRVPLSPFMHQKDPMGLHRKKETGIPESDETNDDSPFLSDNQDHFGWEQEKARQRDYENSKTSSWDKVRDGFNRDSALTTSHNHPNDDDPFDDFLSKNETHPYQIEKTPQDEFDELLKNERNP